MIRKTEMAEGSFITQSHVTSLSKVAVLGPQVVSDLFGEGANAVGQTIRINGQTLTVIGGG